MLALIAGPGLVVPQILPNSVAEYLDKLRHMDKEQREALFNSASFQNGASAQQELHEKVYTPLVMGDLTLYTDTIEDALSDPDPYIRGYAVSLVGAAGASPMIDPERLVALKKLVPSLIALTRPSERAELRINALKVLAILGPTKHPALVDTFKSLISDKEAGARGASLLGLARLPDQQSFVLVEALAFMRDDSDAQNRMLAATILRETPLDDPRIMKTLKASLNDSSVAVQKVVAHALLTRGKPNEDIVSLLKTKMALPETALDVRVQVQADLATLEH